jgi:thiamine-phosphate diphosphorylase
LSFRPPAIYAISPGDARSAAGVEDIARRFFGAGIRLLQVREPRMSDRDLLEAVEAARRQGSRFGATVLVNDRTDVARLGGVGVHLGEDDLPAALARPLLAPGAPLGVSTHDLAAARSAFADGNCDYVAFGPVFESATKTGRAARGTAALAAVAAEKTKPLVAVGGVTADRLDAVFDAGADSAAVVGALAAGGRLEENARALLDRARRRDPPGRLYFVGFMGCGKTAIGRHIAARTGIPFVDLDTEIEKTSGLTVRALFESLGEPAFRERESAFLQGTEALPNAIVSTGGGSYVSEGNRRTIARLGTAIFLDVPLDALLARISGKTDRPLFVSATQAASLHREREPFYRMAPVHVSLTGRESIEEAADKVLSAVYDRRELNVSL